MHSNSNIEHFIRALYQCGIVDYKIVRHISYQYWVEFKTRGELRKLVNKKETYDLFFSFQSATAHISLPPITQEALENLIRKHVENNYVYINEYLRFSISDYLQLPQSDVKAYNFNFNNYILSSAAELVAYNEKHIHNVLLTTHEYVILRTDVVMPDGSFGKTQVKNCIVQMRRNNGATSTFAAVRSNGVGMYDSLKKLPFSNFKIRNSSLIIPLEGVVLFPPKMFDIIFSVLVSSLNGKLISTNQGYVKREWIGTRILDESLSVVYAPELYGIDYDAEGSPARNRLLIDHGVLVGCCNDSQSAIYLQQDAGNTYYEYLTNEIYISTNYTEFLCDNRITKHDDAITVVDIEPIISYNNETGHLAFSCAVKGKQTRRKYCSVSMSLLSFFNGIIGEYGRKAKIDTHYVPGVVVDFNRISASDDG